MVCGKSCHFIDRAASADGGRVLLGCDTHQTIQVDVEVPRVLHHGGAGDLARRQHRTAAQRRRRVQGHGSSGLQVNLNPTGRGGNLPVVRA